MLNFVVNPIAGGKRGKKMLKALAEIQSHLAKRQVEYSLHVTKRKSHAKELTANLIAQGVDNVICVGGDGTLHEVINGFSNFDKVALGIIPCGTGNDFASALNIPKEIDKALDLILDGKPQYTDFMQMPTVRGLNVIGMGVDVDVLKRYEALKKKSKWGYTSCLIKTLFHVNFIDFEAELNGEKSTHRSFIAAVCNGNRFGGGIEICPPATPTDGKLDFVAVKEIHGLKIVGAFLKLKGGKVLSLPQASHSLTDEVKVTVDGDYTVNVDGELYDNIPFEIKVIKDTLRVWR